VTLKAVPPVAEAGALTVKWVAVAALTAIVLLVPVMDAVTVSVAVRVWLPAVLRVALKVPTPLVSVELPGSVAAPSVLPSLRSLQRVFPAARRRVLPGEGASRAHRRGHRRRAQS